MKYVRHRHAARETGSYVFQQLIPYIGNKRKLLTLIGDALEKTEVAPSEGTFVDLFAGSGVVSRYAKHLGFRVVCNDWEPYAESLNRCFIEANEAPRFAWGATYDEVIQHLNQLEPVEDWVTNHLCPRDDENYDPERDRMFYMRKNGKRIDAIRLQIEKWDEAGKINSMEKHCLLAPLLYQACYTSNTSGVFKGFHRGWGGQTRTALYRIAGDLCLRPPVFLDNERDNAVFRADATAIAHDLALGAKDVVYIDPPYNQHPYGSNYHVLNSIVLWDKPKLSREITDREKSAIRTDWRTSRRSAYNSAKEAGPEYNRLLDALSARWVLTSYSTDGNIDLMSLIRSNVERGRTDVLLQAYKRYRVSSARPSAKPMNIEFILLTDLMKRSTRSAEEIAQRILDAERDVLALHPETAETPVQEALF
jgi:adenine-specific DNA-methyltransferase